MKKYLLLFLAVCLTTTIYAQWMTRAAVVADLNLLKREILHYQPAVELYHPAFAANADTLIDAVPDSMNIFDAFGFISRLCALANEGHFELGTWEDQVHVQILKDQAPFLPIATELVDEKIYIVGDFTEQSVFQKGDQILSINDYTDMQIIDRLISCTPTDGHITSYGYKRISDNFPWFYYFYVERPEEFTIQYMPYGSSTVKTATVTALTKTQRQENHRKRSQESVATRSESLDDFYDLVEQDNFTVLRLKSFDYRLVEQYQLKAKKFYGELFKSLQKKELAHLVVDLRGNTGGRNEFGEDIVPFIMKGEAEAPYLSKSISWKGAEKKLPTPKPSKNGFRGKIFVLVDGYTYSTGAVVARYLKEYGKATVIGEETGTRYEGFVAGSSHYVTLPNTNLRIGIPRYHKVFPTSELQNTTNRGLIPDHVIVPTIEAIVEEKDLAMELLKHIIDK